MVFRSNKLVGTNANRGSHAVPGFDCTCGIYCSKTFDHLRRGQFWQYGSVHGEVNVWGLSVEHEHGFRASSAYPKTLYLSSEMLPVKLKTFQAQIQGLIAYGCDVFIDHKTSSVPLWRKQTGLDAATLDLLMSRSKEWYARRKHGRTIRAGDRIALLGWGVAVVTGVNEKYVHAVLWNRQMVTLNRNRVLWHQENVRWEAASNRGVGSRGTAYGIRFQ